MTRRLRIEALEDRRMLATFTVGSLDDAGIGSLREAILNANNQSGADTIDFNLGLFATPQTLDLVTALPTIAEDLTIVGPGRDRLTLHAGNGTDNLPGTGDGFRLFDIDDNNASNLLTVAIQNMTLTGGDVTGAGGAIRSRENLTTTDVAIVANATGPGTPGISTGPGQNGGNGGSGGFGGGIYSSGGNLTVIGSTISGNSTGDGGNGGSGGDGADGAGSDDAPGQRGGNGGIGGSGGYGGGIFTDGGDLVVTNSTISGNSTGAGGLGGSAGDGGEGDIGGDGGDGGDGGYGGNGGGIYSSVGNVTITRSTFSGNFTGLGSDGASGGVGGFGGFSGDGGDGGNGGSGGGLYSVLYSVEGQLEISMSTITGNRASGGGLGGGSGTGGVIGNNGSNGDGGGVDSLGNDPVLIDNSILAVNHSLGSAPDLRTGLVTLNVDFSLIGNGDGLVISNGTGNQIGTSLAPINPQLGPLADNGGPTQTHALLTDSLAIDAGDPSILFDAGEFDQRGAPFVRVEDGNLVAGVFVDLGAYEAQGPPSADFDQDNDIDGADFLRWQRGFGITSGALPANGNSDDDEDVDASDLAVWQATYGTGAAALQAQQTEPAPPQPLAAATPPSQVFFLDLALATFDQPENRVQTADATEPEFFLAKLDAKAFAEISSTMALKSAPTESQEVTASAENEIAEIELQLRDALLSILF